VLADAVRFSKPATDVMEANVYNTWHSFSVKDTVQGWLDGTHTNHGFVVKATDESVLGRGGPRYEASEFAYGGETATYPKLVLTYGTPSTTLHWPTTIHATGAELTWDAYTNASGDAGDEIVDKVMDYSMYWKF
jgi:hypothetical protein